MILAPDCVESLIEGSIKGVVGDDVLGILALLDLGSGSLEQAEEDKNECSAV